MEPDEEQLERIQAAYPNRPPIMNRRDLFTRGFLRQDGPDDFDLELAEEERNQVPPPRPGEPGFNLSRPKQRELAEQGSAAAAGPSSANAAQASGSGSVKRKRARSPSTAADRSSKSSESGSSRASSVPSASPSSPSEPDSIHPAPYRPADPEQRLLQTMRERIHYYRTQMMDLSEQLADLHEEREASEALAAKQQREIERLTRKLKRADPRLLHPPPGSTGWSIHQPEDAPTFSTPAASIVEASASKQTRGRILSPSPPVADAKLSETIDTPPGPIVSGHLSSRPPSWMISGPEAFPSETAAHFSNQSIVQAGTMPPCPSPDASSPAIVSRQAGRQALSFSPPASDSDELDLSVPPAETISMLVKTVKDLQAEVKGVRSELEETQAAALEMRQTLMSGSGQIGHAIGSVSNKA
ncbi:uncharacterized protein MKK02DRAFT_42661 [Dioszegia hungarica]|uniref:Uncharacterized protein n=1 Tax=Dioszegia hungarica TaxID=4972 RepID=A0AA38HDQ4_9TREE|nr:uncharacterized protein MKK02DRAFT_42661 [Dioszegia hungarica]KAI9638270.1 hypothetical protein MKK02DRAFT_42661 [Dioszegia hungarica]